VKSGVFVLAAVFILVLSTGFVSLIAQGVVMIVIFQMIK